MTVTNTSAVFHELSLAYVAPHDNQAYVTGSGRGGKSGELACGGGIYKGEILAGQPDGKGQFYASQVLCTL